MRAANVEELVTSMIHPSRPGEAASFRPTFNTIRHFPAHGNPAAGRNPPRIYIFWADCNDLKNVCM